MQGWNISRVLVWPGVGWAGDPQFLVVGSGQTASSRRRGRPCARVRVRRVVAPLP
jgi:hypothetical protein